MSPRRRTVHDREVLAAVARIAAQQGPHAFTLADVSAEVGLSPGTLIQRFGTKRGLLLATARQGLEDTRSHLMAVESVNQTGKEALQQIFRNIGEAVGTPEELANHLAFLTLDLADPEFLEIARSHSRLQFEWLARVVSRGQDDGSIPNRDPKELTELVQATLHGCLVCWAMRSEDTLVDYLLLRLEALLEPCTAG